MRNVNADSPTCELLVASVFQGPQWHVSGCSPLRATEISLPSRRRPGARGFVDRVQLTDKRCDPRRRAAKTCIAFAVEVSAEYPQTAADAVMPDCVLTRTTRIAPSTASPTATTSHLEI